MRQRLYVWMDYQDLVGRLDFNVDGGRQNSVFTYAQSWIDNPEGYDLSPFMPRSQRVASASRQGNSSPLVMPIADSTPDSWGCAIMRAANGGRAMNDFEYLIGVGDFLRSGALRFYESDAADALPLAQPRTGEKAYSIPRLIELEAMIHEARALEQTRLIIVKTGQSDDMAELWTRMAYSVLIQNTDDHLRNHGFIRTANRWALSPAYDINPDPSAGGTLKTAISDIHGNELKILEVLDAAPLFNIDINQAREALRVMAEIIKGKWRLLASELGMTAKDIKALAPAFESAQVQEALSL